LDPQSLDCLSLADLFSDGLKPLVPARHRVVLVLLGDCTGSVKLTCSHGKVGIEVIVLHLGFGRLAITDQTRPIDPLEIRQGLLGTVLDELIVR
jgi:hypothetical protein